MLGLLLGGFGGSNRANITNTSVNGTSDVGGDFIAIVAPVASVCLVVMVYAVGMVIANRDRLYHTWNHLVGVIFFAQAIRLLFIVSFVIDFQLHPDHANPDQLSCAFVVTFLDAFHVIYSYALAIMLCVMMVPLCFEPEKRLIFRFELNIALFLAVVVGLQVTLYAVAGEFGRYEDAPFCHNISISLSALFEWAPCFINAILSIAFLFWVRSQIGRAHV